MTVFRLTLALTLGVLLAGLAMRAWSWFSPFQERLPACAGAVVRALCSRKLFILFRSVVIEVFLQGHVLRDSGLRWLAHFSLFAGFLGLFFMHALEPVLARPFFPGYEPTLDPYQFLRNLFGAMVLFGAILAVCRRLAIRRLRQNSRFGDWLPLALIILIMLSGYAFEAAKMVSEAAFDRMVADYMPAPEPEELAPLRAYWAHEYGTAFADPPDIGPTALEAGKSVNESYCAACHSPPGSAFLSRSLALAVRPLAPSLERSGAALWLDDVHFGLFFLFVAMLPFTKLLHILTAPVSLLRRAVCGTPGEARGPAALAGRALGLDACVHCGVCGLVCSVGPSAEALANPLALPSEKLAAMADFWVGKTMSVAQRGRLAEGVFTCTACYKCSSVCPCGIDLQDLWLASKRSLRRANLPEPYVSFRKQAEILPPMPDFSGETGRPGRMRADVPLGLTDDPLAFEACVQCSTCTSVCPVVASAGIPSEEVDASPHQIMNLVRMGLRDAAIGSRMVWNCVTCYKCQEFCPQGIKVADVLFELRNLAHARRRDSGFADREKPEGRGA